MKKHVRRLKSILATSLNIPFVYRLETYSQEGEDIVLRKLLEKKKKGFYIDVGAHHPFRYSNAFWFYKNGWRGINIDAAPGTKNLFDKVRPRDKTIEAAVGKTGKHVPYFMFEDSALNTLDKKIADKVVSSRQSILVKTLELPCVTLASILDTYLPKKKTIDLLNIDAEGKDLEILESNNWKKFSPRVVCVEVGSNITLGSINSHKITIFLKKKGYKLTSKLFNSAIFVKK